ncbi:MAG TPA: tetratricopeptide repeat protein, partial [bacterium]
FNNFTPASSQNNPLQKGLTWAKAHQEIVAVSGIVLLLLIIGIPYYLHSQEQSEKDAMGVLSLGQYYLHSQVDPKNGPFKTNLEKNQQSLQTFQRITTDYPGTKTSKIARYYTAKCQYTLGQFAQAYSSFEAASQELKGSPLSDEAYFGKILCLESQTQWTQAATLAETFLKTNSDSFIAPEIHLNLSDIYLNTQNKDKALDQLKMIVQSYSDTNWGKEAARRLENLKS